MTAIFIPVKALPQAKSRLAGVLRARVRKRLVLAMVADLLRAVRDGAPEAVVFVASEDKTLARWLRVYHRDVRFLTWPGGLNEVCDRASEEFCRAGYSHMVVLHGDLPCANAEEIRALAVQEPDVALVGDRHGTGTNALVLPLPCGFTAMFGAGSLQRHMAQCERLGLRFRVVSDGGLTQDLDTPQDLAALCLPPHGHTACLLAQTLPPQGVREVGWPVQQCR